jgi:hypothetical protein
MRHITRGAVDQVRATRRAGVERVSERSPGLLVVAAAGLAFVVWVTNFALGEARGGIAAAVVGLLGFGAGLSWVAMDRGRIRDAEREWPMSHPAR